MTDDYIKTNAPARKKKSLLPLIILNGALMAVLVYFIAYFFSVAAPMSGKTAERIPAFGMQSAMYEGSFTNESLKGDVFLLNIFASWCPPCEAEHPLLLQITRETGVPLYGIALQDEPENLENFLERLGNPYADIGMDFGGVMPGALGTPGVPTTFLVDGDLNILDVWKGPINPGIVESEILPFLKNRK